MREKLVRDNIISIRTREEGVAPRYRVLKSFEERMQSGLEKIREESEELCTAGSRQQIIEELADLTAIKEAVMGLLCISAEELQAVRLEKKQRKGEYEEWIAMELP